MFKRSKGKAVALLIALIMVLSAFPAFRIYAGVVNAADNRELALSVHTGAIETTPEGRFVDVEIRLDANRDGITVIMYDLQWNPNVITPVINTDIPVGPGGVETIVSSAGVLQWMMAAPIVPNTFHPNNDGTRVGQAAGGMVGMAMGTISTDTGTLATIRFRVLDNAPIGSSIISIHPVEAGRGTGPRDIIPDVVNGVLTIPAPAVITITEQPTGVIVTEGAITGNLTVTATVTEGATLSYQWYQSGTAILGATNASLPIPTNLAVGIHDFHVVVSATGGAQNVASSAAAVTVNAPTVTLTPTNVSIYDTNITATSAVSGTATGTVTVDDSNLPAGVTASVSGTTVTITGERPPHTAAADITGTFTVPVTRQGITTNLSVNVNLTRLPADAPTVVLSPLLVAINNTGLTRTSIVSGTATGTVTVDGSALPAGVTASVSGTTITIIGVRPPHTATADINGTFTVPVTRQGVTTNLTVNVNLTRLPAPSPPGNGSSGNESGNNNQPGGGAGAAGGGSTVQPPVTPPEPPIDEPQEQRLVLQLIFTVGQSEFLVHGISRQAVGVPFIDPATDRMMIPLRTLAESTGALVEWNDVTRSAEIHFDTGLMVIPVNVVLGEGLGTAMLVNDRMFVPLRFVMEAMDAVVEWYEPNQQAIISWYE